MSRSAFFLKTPKPPPIGTPVRISLTLPSGSTVELGGRIRTTVGPGEMSGRGPGIDIALLGVPQSVMWLIESALSSAGITPRPVPEQTESAAVPQPSSDATAPDDSSPNLDEGDEWVSAEGELVQALWHELTSMSKMNAFQLLGIPYTASDAEVRLAFGRLSKKYHPDRFTRYESLEIRELANEVFILLRNAYRKLADIDDRKSVLAAIETQGAGESPAPRTPPAQTPAPKSPTPRATRNAIGSAKERGGAPAAPKVSPATQSYSQSKVASTAGDPVPAAQDATSDQVSMAMNILESGQYEQALRILRTAARKNPNNLAARAGVELAEGRLALANGDRMEAAERFEAALDVDPSNERAAREIAEMRRHATSQRRGLLSKLMKKV